MDASDQIVQIPTLDNVLVSFDRCGLPWAMPNEWKRAADLSDLPFATPEEVTQSLAYALRYNANGKPRSGGRDSGIGLDTASSIVAEHLVEHLRLSGFIVLRGPPARSTA